MANEMRDRLVELCGNSILSCKTSLCEDCEHINNDYPYCMALHFADHLIENGVVVPPCKVGDKVYKITRNKVKECEVVFVGISADEKCSYFNFVENYTNGTFYKSYSMVFDVIGKTVFLTKSEAEQKLKEMRGEQQ